MQLSTHVCVCRRMSQLAHLCDACLQSALLEEVSGPAGRRLRQQLANAREQLQALMILAKVRVQP
eukprot:COSAG02_NODE_62152_length_266_cov_1.239521_1_plen_64_part_01